MLGFPSAAYILGPVGSQVSLCEPFKNSFSGH